MTRRRTWCVALVAGLLLALAPSAPAGSTGSKPAFTTWDETFVDESRVTPEGAASPAAPSRTLVTTIYRPRGKGPFPLIMFSHGLSGHPEKFTEIFAVWAEAGYVVAAPAFPLTNDHVPSSSSNIPDLLEQPADVSFVLDQVLALDEERGSKLFKAIDEDRIGAAGLSLGGATTYGVAFSECCRDDRLISAAVLNGFATPIGDGGEIRLDGHIPLFIGHSDTDPLLSFESAQSTFDRAVAPVWFVTLHGASFTLVFITAQIYLDERIDPAWRARAQALMSLMTGGVGNLIGYLATGWWFAANSESGRTAWPVFWTGLACVVALILSCFLGGYRGRGTLDKRAGPKPA